MKPEEAKEILQNRISLTQNVWSNVPDIIEYRKALELAVRRLEKQIPKKVTNLKEIYIGLGNEQKTKVGAYGDCPICHSSLFSGADYCNKCGQRLDWRLGRR